MANVDKLTVIHLNHSCSQSVLWLLEELGGIEYDVRTFKRAVPPAPELKETHPQGKSPQLLVPGGRVITQLSAVLLYLLQTYDTKNRFHQPSVDDAVREEQLVCLGVCDLSYKLGTKLLFEVITIRSPFFLRPIIRSIRDTLNRMMLDPDVEAIVQVLEAELEGREWFMGRDGPTRADFVLHFFVGLGSESKIIKLDANPRLAAWMARCEAREAWKRSLEKGNGYVLDVFEQIKEI